jgi:hypothetical protein
LVGGIEWLEIPSFAYALVMTNSERVDQLVDIAIAERRPDGDAFTKIDKVAIQALAGVKGLAIALDRLTERVDALEKSPSQGEESMEVASELADLRRQVKKLTKSLNRKSPNKSK